MKLPNFNYLLDDFSDGGGGGPVDSGGAADSAGSPSGGGRGDGAGTVYDLNDDTPIRIKGQKEPVKFGDWYKGLRSSQTKEAQKAAELERKYGELEGGHKSLKQQYDSLLAAVQKARETGDKTDALAELRALQYIDGGMAARIVEAVQQRIQQTDAGFQERDKAIVFLGRQLAGVMKQLEGYNSRTQQQDFQSKIGSFLKQGGYGDEYRDFAQELYLAYEGEDLDEEFPNILKNRIGQLERAMKAREAKAQADRRKNLFIPGKDTNGASPSGPLSTKRLGRMKPKDLAGLVFDQFIGDQQSAKT